jgi:hypothetical protein
LGVTRNTVQKIEKIAFKKFKRELARRLKHVTDYI